MEYLLLIAAGFAAGFINTLAGGGTLLTLPALIFLGLDPNVANGTNRIAIFLQTGASVLGFKSKGESTAPFSIYLAIPALLGSFVGAQLASDIDGALFKDILSIIMILVVIAIVFKPKHKLQELQERLTGKHLWISMILFFFVGIYGGFINAGIGFIILLILPYINRMSLLRSNVTKVMVVCIYTISAIITFQINGLIDWKVGFIMATGNITGAWIASRWSVKKGDGIVKVFLVIMVTAMAIKLWFF
ncbi:MAG: sulfite exporter TauE/SafE family protein [Flavobacteriaceae bacterium]|nr:sulfite exporter TauE/SafE family protein [Flavobacteriaceae bacterium]